ncbi:MAG: glycosyltransferase [Patescibacteria group bacterium]|nr:glycosyltransferase [Patescibacteria group bacterium]
MKISLISPIMSLSEELANMTKQMIHDVREGMIDECELIIIDNASTHGSEYMKEGADIYVRLEENRGWGGGINVGMKLATGEYFVFVNNDITINQTGWAEKLIGRFESKPKIGTISMNGSGGFSGAFFAIRREIYDKIGGFDEENFPLGHAQDCDYLYRLMYEGWDDNVLLIDGYRHYGRKTYNQHQFKDKYLHHDNFAKSDFKKKWGFTEREWEARGHLDWRRRIELDPSLDRYNELPAPI